MKRHYTLLLLLNIVFVNAQLVINTTQSPTQIVQNTLIGSGITVFNIKFNGVTNLSIPRDQISSFSTGTNPTNIGISEGVILATGKTAVALGPNNLSGASIPTSSLVNNSDVDLAVISNPYALYKAAVLEFDFIPSSENISLNFVFASEEYPEYSTSIFNDVLGIFLSGPAISGPFSFNAKNIATIPTTTTGNFFVSMNNINNGSSNTGPCTNCNYYINNINPSSAIQYDGFTTEIAINSQVQSGQVYHIKFAISNVADNSFDSALFFKASSFSSTSLKVESIQNKRFSIYPNPANTSFTIKSNQVREKFKNLKIIDLMGKEVKFFKEINSNNFSIDVSDVSKGIYIVEIENNDSMIIIEKLIIK
jgi:Secretion system C-terminal sorting domain